MQEAKILFTSGFHLSPASERKKKLEQYCSQLTVEEFNELESFHTFV